MLRPLDRDRLAPGGACAGKSRPAPMRPRQSARAVDDLQFDGLRRRAAWREFNAALAGSRDDHCDFARTARAQNLRGNFAHGGDRVRGTGAKSGDEGDRENVQPHVCYSQ
ncbi:MAG: hypothetical protein KGM42_06320 [Hyphomicrobiales bacterium]|nr:hypothetical protein [Hyphomicrobiales bacterium]